MVGSLWSAGAGPLRFRAPANGPRSIGQALDRQAADRTGQASATNLPQIIRAETEMRREGGQALQPSLTVYKRHGKGPRQHLRFSKTGDPNLEAAYATHLIRLGQ